MKRDYAKCIIAFIISGFTTSIGFCQGSIYDDLYSPMNIDNTGIISSHTDFGQRINYSDGSYFRGIVQNGKRKSGTVYFKDGRRESCYDYDENGYFNGFALQEWTDGSWYVGYWNHGKKNGEGTQATVINGSLKYYDEVWVNGTCTSSQLVNKPKLDKKVWTYTPTLPVNGTNSSNGRSRSTNSSSRECPYCRGTGSVETNRSVGTYGLNTSKRKCATCGKWIMAGTAHSHTPCRHCNSTGRLR